MEREIMTLASLCDGAVQERINHALQKVTENILDPNTDPKKKRDITLKLSFEPNPDDREDVAVDVSVGVKLAPETGLKTQFFLSKDLESGMVSITEHAKGQIKGQLSFDDFVDHPAEQPHENLAPPTAEELGCDPETGEILENGGKVVDLRKATG